MPTYTIGPGGDYSTPQAWYDDHVDDPYLPGEWIEARIIAPGDYGGLLCHGSTANLFRLTVVDEYKFRGDYPTVRLQYIWCPGGIRLDVEHLGIVGDGYRNDLDGTIYGLLSGAGTIDSCYIECNLNSLYDATVYAFVGIQAALVKCCVVADCQMWGQRPGGIGGVVIQAVEAHYNVINTARIVNDYWSYFGEPGYATLEGIVAYKATNNAVFTLICEANDPLYIRNANSFSAPDIDYNAVGDGTLYAGGPHGLSAVSRLELDSRYHLTPTSRLRGAGSPVAYEHWLGDWQDIDDEPLGEDIGADSVLLPRGTGAAHGQHATASGPAAALVAASGGAQGQPATAAGVATSFVTAAGACHGSRSLVSGWQASTAAGTTHGGRSLACGAAGVCVTASGAMHGRQSTASGAQAIVVRYYADARGLYRIFAPAEYRLYRSNVAPPEEGSAPWATAAELPTTSADVFADGAWYVAVSWFNGIYDSGFAAVGPNGETYLVLEVISGEAHVPPIGPLTWQLIPLAGGVVRLSALLYTGGPLAPDEWTIGYTVDGTTPPTDAPDVTEAMSTSAVRVLAHDLPAQADGTLLKVRLQTRRNDGTAEAPVWIYSRQSGVLEITIDATATTAPLLAVTWNGKLELDTHV